MPHTLAHRRRGRWHLFPGSRLLVSEMSSKLLPDSPLNGIEIPGISLPSELLSLLSSDHWGISQPRPPVAEVLLAQPDGSDLANCLEKPRFLFGVPGPLVPDPATEGLVCPEGMSSWTSPCPASAEVPASSMPSKDL